MAFPGKEKMVATFLPERVAEELGLVCLFKGKSRSKVIREALEEVIEKSRPIPEIILDLARQAAVAFDPNEQALCMYERKIRQQLLRKKIARKYIDQIIIEMRKQI
jgi:metal-responsive CopG/Arc/MetJ family transcriptional regulator